MTRLVIIILTILISDICHAATPTDDNGGLITVAWGQDAPYNAMCPVTNGTQTLPGCVAVTMAQMMSYWQYPQQPTGEITYSTTTRHIPIMETLDDYHIDWPAILNGTASPDTLLYLAGVAAHTDYTPLSSNAQPTNQIHALVENFGYDEDITIYSRACLTDSAWRAIIANEISDARPVMVSARDPQHGGHSFIIDGYSLSAPSADATAHKSTKNAPTAIVHEIEHSDGALQGASKSPYVHVNWGWAGKCNGWYPLDSLAADGYSFSDEQRIIVGCMPDDGKQTVNCYLEADLQLSDTVITISQAAKQSLRLATTVYNRTYRTFNGYYYVYVTFPDGYRVRFSGKKYIGQPLITDYSQSDNISLTRLSVLTNDIQTGRYTLSLGASELLGRSDYSFGLTGTTSFTVVPDTADGITELQDSQNNAAPSASAAYNLQGQRVSTQHPSTASRIVIINGRKHICH